MDSTATQTKPAVRQAFAILREQREEQIRMAEMVDRAIAGRTNAVIEAGTGTGKSFGYMIPVVSQGRRAIVATFTIALQEQLIHHDIPFLQDAVRARYGITFKAAMLKGSSNYTCMRRLAEASGMIPAEIEEWGGDTPTGDLSEAPEMDAATRETIRIDLDDCGKQKCPFFEQCHYQRAKVRARAADILVVNHKLFSMGLENPFLLDLSGYDAVIIDEAHQWEDVARESFGGRLSPVALSRLFGAVERELVDKETEEDADGKRRTVLEPSWLAVRDAFRRAWLEVIAPWMGLVDEDGEPFLDTELLVPVDVVRRRSQKAGEAFAGLSSWVCDRLTDKAEHNRIERQLEGVRSFFTAVKAGDVITVAARKIREGAKMASVTMETYPLFVGPRLQESLYPLLPVIYTSATISAGGDFTLSKDALGLAADVPTAEIGSPFDYFSQSLLYVPRDNRFDGRKDNREGHLAAFCREVETLLEMSQGRAFILFTGTANMRDAFHRRRHRFPARWQEPGVNKNALIAWFKETPNAVLYATSSFWEGVSIEGEDLSLVVIDKIPFAVPSDPIYKAKAARLVGQKDFFVLSVPSAIIKLKQGFGRLIRTKSDRGMVAILDSRIVGKGYGRGIIAALPPARLVHDLGDRALIASYLAPVTLEAEVADEPPTAEQLAEAEAIKAARAEATQRAVDRMCEQPAANITIAPNAAFPARPDQRPSLVWLEELTF